MVDIGSSLAERYGSGDIDISIPVSSTVETLLQHRSVRHFLPDPISSETIEVIFAAAQSAPTSSNLQSWSAIAVEDKAIKDQVATLSANQDFIRQAPLLFVFCADLSRLTTISRQQGTPGEGLEYTEMFLVASLDAALAAQNALVCAQSLGFGGCYVGAARNRPRELASLLKLPPRVVALFGLALGKPDPEKATFVKPRLPQRVVLHRDTWNESDHDKDISAYDATLSEFYVRQKRLDAQTWTDTSASRVATPDSLSGRAQLREILLERDFNLK